MDWHSFPAAEALRRLDVNMQDGLPSSAVPRRREENGRNQLRHKKGKGFLRRFLEQFSDFMVIILLIAAAISFITSFANGDADFVDPIIILVIVIINAIIGVVQEFRAERAIEALQKMSAPEARVLRDGRQQKIPSEDVVVGDIILLETGDFIPADARLLSAENLKAEESSLTGESVPVSKNADQVFASGTPVAERKNMVFSSTSITSGRGTAVVTAVGMDTQVGKIASMLMENETPSTPLQVRLAKTGKILGIAALAVCLAIFAMGLIQKVPPLEMFMISVSLAVAAIPEGLPAVVTIVLALGVRKMANNRAIIRKLPAVETLGSASVICSDKTGTLTQNQMTVTEVTTPSHRVPLSSLEAGDILSLGALCNNAVLTGPSGRIQAEGDPTESAIVIAAAQCGKRKPELERQWPRVAEIPFDSSRKLMTTIHRLPSGKYRIITKGAPDVLVQRCTSFVDGGDNCRAVLQRLNQSMAERALRVLGVAYRDCASLPIADPSIETGLTFLGLIGMVDPPRPEVKEAVRKCKRAGIKPVMITGDHIVTAKAIGAELGILTSRDKAMTGAELDQLPQKELAEHIYEYAVFARVSPEHKVRIVRAFQSRGAVVAMTGDGVNDAPALQAADIGCAMGQGGTDVAKGAADMILTDDNFATIVEAVREGRGIYANIKKAVHFLLSCNIGEIMTVFVAFLLHMPTPLLAIQLLWVNLVTDSLPALALGVEPGERDVMNHKPINPKKSLFADGLWYNILIEGMMIGSLALLAFTIGRSFFDLAGEAAIGRTMAFAVLSISQLVHAFSMRSEHSIFSIGLFTNKKMVYAFLICLALQSSVITVPFLSAIFKTAALSGIQWLIVVGLSILPLVLMELEKKLRSLRQGRRKK